VSNDNVDPNTRAIRSLATRRNARTGEIAALAHERHLAGERPVKLDQLERTVIVACMAVFLLATADGIGMTSVCPRSAR